MLALKAFKILKQSDPHRGSSEPLQSAARLFKPRIRNLPRKARTKKLTSVFTNAGAANRSSFEVLWTLMDGGRRFTFGSPILTRHFQRADIYVIECLALYIEAFGQSADEAKAAFSMEFGSCWDIIATASNDELTLDARVLKDRLQRLVIDVQHLS